MLPQMRSTPLLTLLVLLPLADATGATYVVRPDGLGDYPTVQGAITAATDGDIIELTDGTFTGDGNRDIMVPSRSITIRSHGGDPMSCIIDCEGSALAEHRGFYFDGAVGTGDVTLQGIGVVNGYTTANGGGILIEDPAPIIENCIVAHCTADGALTRGSGVYGRYDSGTLVNCIIAYTEDGCGVAAEEAGGEPTLSCCDVYGNVEGNYDAIVGDQTGLDNNFSLPPEFCDLEVGDYRLFDTSPCLAVASPCGLLVGAFDEGCDSPVDMRSWGVIKANWMR